jgi:hypothetical protein
VKPATPERETKPETPAETAAAPARPAETRPAETARPAASTSRFAQTVTRGERDGLSLAIKRYFTYNGNRSDRSLQVTIGIELDQTGKIVGQPQKIRASGGDASTQNVLYESGRRALYRAASAGEFAKLPAAKYEAWRVIHVTFTPEEIGFSS